MAGIATFPTMAYITVAQPAIQQKDLGMGFGAVFTATIIPKLLVH